MSGQRSQVFGEKLLRFATEVSDRRVMEIAERVAAPIRVAVAGRGGSGRRTVMRALECVGTAVTAPHTADVLVHVVAEVAKPEDTAAVAAARLPVLVVLNKKDLAGAATAAAVSARMSAPVVPMAALPAVAALDNRIDDALWDALQVLAAKPADVCCADHFVAGEHPVPSRLRRRLCDTIDLSGITHAVDAIQRGGGIDQVGARLRQFSGLDAVVRRLDAVAATVHYQRLFDGVARLAALAVSDGRIGEFLSSDDTAAARMAAAVSVIEAAGLTIDPAEQPTAQLQRAAHWQRYGSGPVGGLHRACAADITRGSLRLWSSARKSG